MTSHPVRPQNLSVLGPTMTALSRRHASELHDFADLTCMARVSLVVWGVMAFGSSGCLITDTPTFGAPVKTRPALSNLKPRPEVVHEIKFQPGSLPDAKLYAPGPTISFDVTSEDLGDDLDVLVLLDFQGFESPATPDRICKDKPPIRAGSLNEKKARSYDCPLELNSRVPSVIPGCHTFTAIVSHDFFPLSANPVEFGDVAAATWFFQVGETGDEPPDNYFPCKPVSTPADAGGDVRVDGGGL